MIDFTGVGSIVIPEGPVAKITKKSGDLIWERSSGGNPPSGYIRVNYIIFDGTQAVETEIIPDYNTVIETVFTREINESRYLYGVLSANNTASWTAYLSNQTGSWRFDGTRKLLGVSRNTKHVSKQDRTGVVLDGTKYTYEANPSQFIAPDTLVLGSGKNTNGGLESTFFVGKIDEFKMYDGDTLIANYIPYMNPNGVYGFWDNIANVFRQSMTDSPLQGA